MQELTSGKPLTACRENYIKKIMDMQDSINYNWFETVESAKKNKALKSKVVT